MSAAPSSISGAPALKRHLSVRCRTKLIRREFKRLLIKEVPVPPDRLHASIPSEHVCADGWMGTVWIASLGESLRTSAIAFDERWNDAAKRLGRRPLHVDARMLLKISMALAVSSLLFPIAMLASLAGG